jgi:hypothetical protein
LIATIKTNAHKTIATHTKDANIPLLTAYVTIKTHVHLTAATHLLDVLTYSTQIATMVMNLPKIGVMLALDVYTYQLSKAKLKLAITK